MARLAWHSEKTPALEVGSPATPHSLVLQGASFSSCFSRLRRFTCISGSSRPTAGPRASFNAVMV